MDGWNCMNKSEGQVRAHPGSPSANTCLYGSQLSSPSPSPCPPECTCGPGFMSCQAPRYTQGLFWCGCRTLRGACKTLRRAPCLGKTGPRVQSGAKDQRGGPRPGCHGRTSRSGLPEGQMPLSGTPGSLVKRVVLLLALEGWGNVTSQLWGPLGGRRGRRKGALFPRPPCAN